MTDTIDLIAVKSMRYATRNLVADEPFQASTRDARLLIAIGKARRVEDAESTRPAGVPSTEPKRLPPRAPRNNKPKAG